MQLLLSQSHHSGLRLSLFRSHYPRSSERSSSFSEGKTTAFFD
jgi:hypothetical protein